MRHPASAILAPIAQYAELNPDATALVEPNGETHSYREFWLRTEACRLRLEEAGVASGQIVAVLAPQGALQIVAVAGVMSHCACAALQPRTTVHEVAAILRRLSACVLVASADFDAELMAAKELGLTILVADAKQSPSQWQIRRSGSARRRWPGPIPRSARCAASAPRTIPRRFASRS